MLYTRVGVIAKSSRRYRAYAIFDFTRVSDIVSSASFQVYESSYRFYRRNFSRKAVAVEFGHQMSLRRGKRPRGLEI